MPTIIKRRGSLSIIVYDIANWPFCLYNINMITIVSILLIAGGIWTLLSPVRSFKMKAKWAKSVGITMTATPRAYQNMRYFGLTAAIVGFLLYFS